MRKYCNFGGADPDLFLSSSVTNENSNSYEASAPAEYIQVQN